MKAKVLTKAEKADKMEKGSSTVAGRVFVDFGWGRLYAMLEEGDGVRVFKDFGEVFSLRPTAVVTDSVPRSYTSEVMEMVEKGVRLFQLRDLRKMGEGRRDNNVTKTHENDVRVIRSLYKEHPQLFVELDAPLLRLKHLTEKWFIANSYRKQVEAEGFEEGARGLRNECKKLSRRIHKEALGIPLYRRVCERFGLKGPSLAYIVSHRYHEFLTESKHRLAVKFDLIPRQHRRRRRISQVLVALAYSVVRNKHTRYYTVFQHYYEKFGKGRKAFWKAILRVAIRILRDINHLAKNSTDNGWGRQRKNPSL